MTVRAFLASIIMLVTVLGILLADLAAQTPSQQPPPTACDIQLQVIDASRRQAEQNFSQAVVQLGEHTRKIQELEAKVKALTPEAKPAK